MNKHGLIVILFLLSGCIANLRPGVVKKKGITEESARRGKEILEESWRTQGFHLLHSHQSYSYQATDAWKGLMGKIGKPWPDVESLLRFKYAIGTFDGQVVFQSGENDGQVAGQQSWSYYEYRRDTVVFMEANPKISFTLAAYQYFMELADRLKDAPIIAYAGRKTFKDQLFDLVFVTWQTPKPHRDHDQYILWINHESRLLEYAEFTIRDNFLKMPGVGAFYGSIAYKDFRKINGILIAHEQRVFMNSPNEDQDKYLHKVMIEDFEFDGFPLDQLYPNPTISKIGNSKIN